MARYYNETTNSWYTEGESVTIFVSDDFLFSGIPTAAQLAEWGYVVYVEPEHDPSLEELKAEKISQIKEYDVSSNVNEFTVNGVGAWFDKETRSNFRGSLSDAELLGETQVSVPINGVIFTLPVTQAKLFLAQIQRYADACTLTTMNHINDVQAFITKKAIREYDITTGYPTKLTFTIE